MKNDKRSLLANISTRLHAEAVLIISFAVAICPDFGNGTPVSEVRTDAS